MSHTSMPHNLGRFRLVPRKGGLGRIILWIIIILVILWFVKRELVIGLWNWILSLIQK